MSSSTPKSRSTPSRTASPRPASPARKPPTAWIIGGVIAVIVVIAAIVAITSSGDDDELATVASAPAAAETGSTDPSGAVAGPTTDEATASSVASTPGTVVGDRGTISVTGAALPFLPKEGDDPALGAQAPTISGSNADGTARTIAPGTPTLVVFVAHWCPHCQREVPRLVEWHNDGGVPAGLDVIAVATATDPRRENFPPSEWLAREGWPFDVILDDADSSAAVAFGLSAYPFFTLLDADGKVVLRDTGELDTGELTERIETALGT